MPLETGSHISDLVITNPAATDTLGQADDHIRLIKKALRTDLPGFTGTPLAATPAQLDAVVSTMFVGTMHSFPKTRADIGSGGGSGITGKNFLEADGSTYDVADFPNLGAYLGSTYGGDGTTTFKVPNLKDTGRFIRSRTASVTVGTSQTNAYKNHAHTATSTAATGSVASSTNTYTPAGTVSAPAISTAVRSNSSPTGGGNNDTAVIGDQTTAFRSDLATAGVPTFTGTATANPWSYTFTGGTPTITVATSTTGDTETRPEAFVAIIALKT